MTFEDLGGIDNIGLLVVDTLEENAIDGGAPAIDFQKIFSVQKP